MREAHSTFRRRVGLWCLAAMILAAVGVARGDDPPTFADPDVTAFVRSYGDFTAEYITFMKGYMVSAKNNDTSGLQAAGAAMQDLQKKAADLQTQSTRITVKLRPDETARFSAYLQGCAQKMVDALK